VINNEKFLTGQAAGLSNGVKRLGIGKNGMKKKF
jgi:hypothetical protein